MFTLPEHGKTYKVPVTVHVPTDSATPAVHEFTAHFQLLEPEAVSRLIDEGIAENNDAPFLHEVMADWEGINQHTGEPLPCTEATREQLAKIRYFARDVIQAYINWCTAVPEKNSGPLPGTTARVAAKRN